jgi:hypothetical protein
MKIVRVVLLIILSLLIASGIYVWKRIPEITFVPAELLDEKISSGTIQSGVPLQGEGSCPYNFIGCHLVIVGTNLIQDENPTANSNIYYTAVIEAPNDELGNRICMAGKMSDLKCANWFRPQQTLIVSGTNNIEMYFTEGKAYRASFTLSGMDMPVATVELWVRWVIQKGVAH